MHTRLGTPAAKHPHTAIPNNVTPSDAQRSNLEPRTVILLAGIKFGPQGVPAGDVQPRDLACAAKCHLRSTANHNQFSTHLSAGPAWSCYSIGLVLTRVQVLDTLQHQPADFAKDILGHACHSRSPISWLREPATSRRSVMRFKSHAQSECYASKAHAHLSAIRCSAITRHGSIITGKHDAIPYH